jgi:DNA-binding transcriptional ArsR family regulator
MTTALARAAEDFLRYQHYGLKDALNHATRVYIIRVLSSREPFEADEMFAKLCDPSLTRGMFAYHIGVLGRHGIVEQLVRAERAGAAYRLASGFDLGEAERFLSLGPGRALMVDSVAHLNKVSSDALRAKTVGTRRGGCALVEEMELDDLALKKVSHFLEAARDTIEEAEQETIRRREGGATPENRCVVALAAFEAPPSHPPRDADA